MYKNFHEIIDDKLYLSNVKPAEDLKFLETIKITHILNLTGLDKNGNKRYRNKFEDKFKYMHICLNDEINTDISKFYTEGIEFIKENIKNKKNKILVHCEAGYSRSPTCWLLYLMKYQNLNLKNSFELLIKKNPHIGPNTGFINYLLKIEIEIFKNNSIEFNDIVAYQIKNFIPNKNLSTIEIINLLKNNSVRETQNILVEKYCF